MNRFLLVPVTSWAAVALMVTALFAGTASAQSDTDRDRARVEFDRGVALYAADNFQGALEAFQEAFRLRPHPTVRVNMANCYDKLNKPVEAIFHYEHYLAESGRTAPAGQRSEVEDALRRLRARVSEVTVRVAPDGAMVVIDDGDSRRAPILEPIRLAAGTHRFETRLSGYRTDQRAVEVRGGAATQVEVRLEREASAVAATGPTGPTGPTNSEPGTASQAPPDGLAPLPPPVMEPTPPEEETSGGIVLTVPTIVVGAASVAVIITAIITGTMASGANAEFHDLAALLSDPTLNADELAGVHQSAVDKADEANGLALATDILGAVGLVGLGVATYLFITDQSDSSDRQGSASSARLGVAPIFSRDGAGVALHGSF